MIILCIWHVYFTIGGLVACTYNSAAVGTIKGPMDYKDDDLCI
jgi:hypothetical protein